MVLIERYQMPLADQRDGFDTMQEGGNCGRDSPGTSAGYKTAKPRAALNMDEFLYGKVLFSPRRWRDWRGLATGVGGGESLTSMAESAISTNSVHSKYFCPATRWWDKAGSQCTWRPTFCEEPLGVSVASQGLFTQCGSRGARRRRGVAGCLSGEQSIPALAKIRGTGWMTSS